MNFYLVPLRPVTVFTGQLSDTPDDPYMDLPYDNGATGTASIYGTSGAPIIGNTVWFGTTPGGRQKGITRLRSWLPYPGNVTQGLIKIAETDDIGPTLLDNDYVTVKLDFRLWGKYPRQTQSGEDITFYEDYDIAYTDQLEKWYPVAVAGPPDVKLLTNETVQFQFVGDRSYALADGATIDGYLWYAPGSVEGTSSLCGDDVNPVVFTYNTQGQHLISLTVTDSNGKSHTNYTWVFVIDPDSITDIAFVDFDSTSQNFDYSSGGGDCNFTVFGNCDVNTIPEGTLVVLATDEQSALPQNCWSFRERTLFVGYVKGNSIQIDEKVNTLTFQATTINNLGKNIISIPTTLEHSSSPNEWVKCKNLTIDKGISYLALWRSNLSNIVSMIPSNYPGWMSGHNIGSSSIIDEMNNFAKDGLCSLVVNTQGILHIQREYQYLLTGTERSTIPVLGTLTTADWLTGLTIEETSENSIAVSKAKLSGVLFTGTVSAEGAMFSAAPSDVLTKAYGKVTNQENLIVLSQDDLNRRCGLVLARGTMPYNSIRMKMSNHLGFDIAPTKLWRVELDSTNNSRGLVWSPLLITRRISRTYDHAKGSFDVSLELEPDCSGMPGVTVTMPINPSKPPGGVTPPIVTGTTGYLLTASSLRILDGESWTLIDNDVTYWLDLSISTGLILRSGLGVIEKSADSGRTWTPYDLSGVTVPNYYGDSSVPSVTGLQLTHVKMTPDGNSIFATGLWQNSNNLWRSLLIKSTDAGETFRAVTAWWLATGMTPSDIAAVYYPAGSSSLVNSYLDLSGNDNNAIATIGFEPELSSIGWTFNGTDQFLSTNIIPTTEYSIFILGSCSTGIIPIGNTENYSFKIGAGGISVTKQGTFIATDTVGMSNTRTFYLVHTSSNEVIRQGTTHSTVEITTENYLTFGKVNGTDYRPGSIKAVIIYKSTLTKTQADEIAAKMDLLP